MWLKVVKINTTLELIILYTNLTGIVLHNQYLMQACCVSVDPCRSPQRSCPGRCGWGEDASLLPVWRYGQHCISHGELQPPQQDPSEPNCSPVRTNI